MTAEELYYDTKWRFENHFKTDDMKEQLIKYGHDYIKWLENKVNELERDLEERESYLEELTCEDWDY
ncbi:TPA: hypothetical protein ACUI25_002003 [Staphylococcus aureus]